MGKITVIGQAEREVSYDQVTISIIFKAHEKTATRASEMVMRQCEDFLAALKKKGISLNQIHLGEDSISESYRSNDEGTIVASRSIKMDVPYNMDFMNYLLRLIQKKGSDATYHTTYNSAMTYSIAFNNCYILLLKSPPTLENAKFVEGELSLRFFLMLYSFPSCYEA